MKTFTRILLSFLVIGMLALSGCAEKASFTPTQENATAKLVLPTATQTLRAASQLPTSTPPTSSTAQPTSTPPPTSAPPSQSLQLEDNLPRAQVMVMLT